MKRIFTLLFAAMLAGQVWADDFTIGKLYYTVTDETNHYVSVSRASNYDTPSGDLVIPESVTDPESNVKYTVTAIANYAFHSCADMTSVTIPGTVTTIGMSAFYNCSGLTTVSLPSSITEIKFDDAFAGCISLASINVAEGNANYASEDGVLFNNDKTRLLYYPASKTGSTYSIPGTVTTISSSAFENCGNLTSITIPNSVSNIGTSAFKNCANLTSITIPESVFTLGNYAFYGCVSLTEINVASGNRNYSSEDGVLFNSSKTKLMCYPACKASSAYTVPESVTSIDEAAFYGCSNLKLVVIPNTVTSLGDGIFQNCASLESATLPNSITYIPAVTFGGCTNLTSIEIPSTVTFIGNSAFSKCGLTTLEIPRSVTEISSFAFQDCKALTTVLIPISVSDIGMNAFKGCSNASFNCEASEKPDDWSSSWNYDNRPVVWGYGSSSKTWKVTLSANNSSYGSVSGGGTVKDGAKVTITATPAEGYKFVKWSNGLTTATATITVTSDLNLVAEFAIIGSIVESELQYEITSDKTVQVIKSADYTELTDIVIPETVEIDGKTYTVTSIGKDAFEYCNKITNVSIPNTVVEISSYAFFNCDNLISMVIPNSVTHIGHGVFYGCDNLTSVNIPNSVISFDNQVFTNCQKLTEINVASDNSHFSSEEGVLFNKDKTELMYFPAGKTGEYSIPNTVTTIADEAFGYCYGLESVNIPNSVKIIDEDAFISTSLTTVNIPDGVKTIGHGAFGNCYYLESATISKTVTELSPMSFYGCSNLTRIDVASGNQNYASDAGVVFNKDKTEIISFPAGKIDTSYTIPNSVTKIGKYAFYNCDKLESITIPESVTSIGDCAFENCDRLTFITIPNSVTSICDYAFENCDNLESIILSESISNIDRNVFARRNSLVYNEFGNGCYLGTANNPYFALIKAKSTDITSCEIHDNCKIIAEGAFGDCNNLQYNEFDGVLYLGNTENPYLLLIKAKSTDITTCEISEGCRFIENSAFDECHKLTSITIPNGVQSIGEYAFYGCEKLETITFPESVRGSIGRYAFYNCESLTSITIPDGVTVIGEYTFYDCENLASITIPKSVTSIGERAFAFCNKLTTVIIPNSVVNIGSAVFDCYNASIYCEAESLPEGWEVDWNPNNCPVVWNAGTNLRLFNVKVTANNSEYGNVRGGGAVVKGFTTKITASTAKGYHFTSWSDGNTDNPRTLTVTSDTVITALFEAHTVVVDAAVPATYTETGLTEGSHCSVCGKVIVEQKIIPMLDNTAITETAANAVNIYAYGNKIVVENATEEIRVYNAMGALVGCVGKDAPGRISTGTTTITINTSGVYIVKVGGVAKRVMVD